MEQIGLALAKLVEQGVPAAQWIIGWYFVVKVLDTLTLVGGFIVVATMAYRLIRRWQEYEFNLPAESRQKREW